MAVAICVKKDSYILLNYGTISWFIHTEVYLAKTERMKEKIATAEPTRI
jgi:hypothetical protein